MSEAGFHSGTEGIQGNLQGQYPVWLYAARPEGYRNLAGGSSIRTGTEACSGATAIPGNTACCQPNFLFQFVKFGVGGLQLPGVKIETDALQLIEAFNPIPAVEDRKTPVLCPGTSHQCLKGEHG